MSRRAEWQKVLDGEVARWEAMSWEDLVSRLRELQVYEVEIGAKKYQVEVEILEDTPSHLQIMVAVDDGSLPASLSPATRIFLREKPLPPSAPT